MLQSPDMQQLRGLTRSRILSVSALVAGSLLAFPARATISILSADGASGFNLPAANGTVNTAAPTNNTVTVYGGTAGLAAGASSTGLIDTCTTVGGRLLACNHQAITAASLITINFTSTTADGVPSITSSYGPVLPANNVAYTNTVAHGGTISFVTTWGQICTHLSQITNEIAQDCTGLQPGQVAQATFNAVITANTTGTTTGTTGATGSSDSGTFTIVVSDGSTVASSTDPTVPACTDGTATAGVCHFEIGNRDSGVSLKNISGTSPFNAYAPIQNILLIYAPGQDTFANIGAPTGDNTKTVSVTTDTTDGSLELQGANVSGFDNDAYYSFKIALQDMAGNISYFTQDGDANAKTGADYSCDSGTECHVGHPGAVEGVLSKNINCFIATAAYGSPMAPQVETFRQFRNAFLIPTRWGRHFVRFYYAHSPKYAHFIAEHPTLRTAARISLYPLLAFAQLSLKIGALNACCALAAVLLFIGSTASRSRHGRDRA